MYFGIGVVLSEYDVMKPYKKFTFFAFDLRSSALKNFGSFFERLSAFCVWNNPMDKYFFRTECDPRSFDKFRNHVDG